MRAVVQRVTNADVKIDGRVNGKIDDGLLVLLGVGNGDTEEDMKYIADKIIKLRIFSDENDKMNLSLEDVGGSMLVISQFTLYGDCSHGRRSYFGNAMEPVSANEMYEKFVAYIRTRYTYRNGRIRCGYESVAYKRRTCYNNFGEQELRL